MARLRVTYSSIFTLFLVSFCLLIVHWSCQPKTIVVTESGAQLLLTNNEARWLRTAVEVVRSVTESAESGLHEAAKPYDTGDKYKPDVSMKIGFHQNTEAVTPLLMSQTSFKPVHEEVNEPSKFEMHCPFTSKCQQPLLTDDSFVRNCITNDIVGQTPSPLKTVRMKLPGDVSKEDTNTRQKSFKKVFDERAWGHDWDSQHRGLNASGMGATLYWTQEAIGTLHVIINQIKQQLGVSKVRILDMPCGDMAWMSRFLRTRDDIEYTGIDIVPDLISHHQQTYAKYPWKFYEWDVVQNGVNITGVTYHLILCRTLLQHLYFADAYRVLNHLSAVAHSAQHAIYLLTTSFSRHPRNEDLIMDDDNPGRFRRLNLEIPPFSLVPPLCIVRDGPPDAYEGWDHFLELWQLPLRRISRCVVSTSFNLLNTDQRMFSCIDWSLKNTWKQ